MDNVLSANFPRLHKTVKTLHPPPYMGIFLEKLILFYEQHVLPKAYFKTFVSQVIN